MSFDHSFSDDPETLILDSLYRNGGNILKTCWELGKHRSYIYQKINELGLWPAVNEIRKQAVVKNLDKTSISEYL